MDHAGIEQDRRDLERLRKQTLTAREKNLLLFLLLSETYRVADEPEYLRRTRALMRKIRDW